MYVNIQLTPPLYFQCIFLIILTSLTSPRFPIWQRVPSPLRHRRVQPDTDHEPWGARGCRVTDDLGCIPLPASHSISGLLSSALLCPCHMYAKQRDREVGCPVCQEAIALHSWPGCIEVKRQRLVVNGLWYLNGGRNEAFQFTTIYYADYIHAVWYFKSL